MVSGNSVNSLNSLPRLNRTHRKMADIGIQCDPLDSDLFEVSPIVNSTVAEINTSTDSGQFDNTPTSPPPFHRPLSVESSKSSSSGEENSWQPLSNKDLDVDAIFVQPDPVEAANEQTDPLSAERSTETDFPERFKIQEPEESNCGLNCLAFTMQCCECTIL